MESPGAITNGKLSVNRTSSGGAAKRGEKTNENRRSSYPGQYNYLFGKYSNRVMQKECKRWRRR